MEAFLLISSQYVLLIFFFKRSLLLNKKIKTILIIVNSILLLIGLSGFLGHPVISKMFMVPFLSQCLFYILNWIFNVFYERDIEDTFWHRENSLWEDSFFNMIYIFLTMFFFTMFAYSD